LLGMYKDICCIDLYIYCIDKLIVIMPNLYTY